jgi:predicted ATPase/DNA-binding CsgD family transcriptional regulator
MARPSRRPGNLPAEATSFIGRRRELAEIRRKLAAGRLLTLVGPGGVGKTRLAIRAASELGRGFSGGGWLVELAEVRDPALVSNAVAAALDLRDQTATQPLALVLDHLRERQVLLVLDNCEHVLEAAGELTSEVIKAAPGVRVIATSREPLSVSGEHVIPVPPLELPSSTAEEPLAQLHQNEAVALFVERAAAASGAFELTASNRVAVADLCRRLDGLPLAIELAAVRLRVLTVEQILERLADRFALLTGGDRAALPRHQTLRTTIDWSHDLLPAEERILLRRLCVFAGRFTLEDVESVCGPDQPDGGQVLDLMSSLVDKSLVSKEDVRGRACYRLHETMHEYAAMRLREAGEQDAIGQRCSEYFRQRCLQALPDARFRLDGWLEWVELEIDNIRAVLRHMLARGEHAAAIDLAVGVGWYWITRATTEGVRWLDEALAGDPITLAGAEALPWAYFLRGFLAVLQYEPATARPNLVRAVAIASERGDRDALVQSLCMSSIAASMTGDRASAMEFLDEAEASMDGVTDASAPVAILQAKVMAGFFEGDADAVRAAAEEGVRQSRELSDLYALEMMSMNLGYADVLSGDLIESRRRFVESLQIARKIDDRVAQYALLYALGFLAAASGQARQAAQLLGGGDTIRTGAGAAVIGFMSPLIEQARDSATAVLGEGRFNAEFESGRRLARAAAIELALGEASEPAEQAADGAGRGPLGKREAEVARLVAEGMSNKEIGARLFISERTVDSHVRSILNKLGFNSRAQIAAWMVGSPH